MVVSKIVCGIALTTLFVLLVSCSTSDETVKSSTTSPAANASHTEIPKTQKELSPLTQVIQGSSSKVSFNIQTGTVARYKIGERLTKFKSPITAIGETERVEGSILIEDGKIANGSLVNVDLTTLKSDENKRDGWIRRLGGIGQTAQILFKSANGLVWPLPEIGPLTFDLTGDLTLSGKTSETIWNVEAEISGEQIKGKAATSITWEQFSLSKPRLPFIISVEDEIKLEIDFIVAR